MASTNTRRRKAPITAHPAFPGIVALWFAVLLGAGSLVVPAALWERIVTTIGLDGLLAAAAPPLGMTARILIALAAAVLGALVGLVIARRVAEPRGTARDLSEEDAHASDTLDAFVAEDLAATRVRHDEDEDALLFSGHDDPEDEALPEFEKSGEPPVFVVPEELAADPIIVTETETEADLPQARETEAETEPQPVEPVAFDQDLAPELKSEPEPKPQQPEPEPEISPRRAASAPVTEEEPLEDLAARLQDALRRRRASQPPVATADETARIESANIDERPLTRAEPEPEPQPEPELETMPEPEADPVVFPQEVSFALPDTQPEEEAWLEDDAAYFEEAGEFEAVPAVNGSDEAGEQPDYDLVAAPGRAEMPRPFLDLDFAQDSQEFADEEEAFDESLDLPPVRSDTLRVTFDTIADNLLDDPPIEAGEEDEDYDEDAGSSYGSLLGMKGPYSSGGAHKEDEFEDGDDLEGDYRQPVFDDDEAEEYDVPAGFEAEAADLAEPEPVDGPAPTAPGRAPLSREEQDAALRDALLSLQRMSGAA